MMPAQSPDESMKLVEAIKRHGRIRCDVRDQAKTDLARSIAGRVEGSTGRWGDLYGFVMSRFYWLRGRPPRKQGE